MQSNLSLNANTRSLEPAPIVGSPPLNAFHVALIMDGNGRWAEQRGLSRLYGHKKGAETIRKIVRKAPTLGIGMLTLYAFSCDNWKRPKEEVDHLFALLRSFLRSEIKSFVRNGIRLKVIGRRDRLPQDLVQQIETAEWASRQGETLVLRVAIDYSAREQILSALTTLPDPTPESLSCALSGIGQDWPVDLLIRTSGEQRLSDFLLWECAYAEFYFSPTHWPDFDGDSLADAMQILSQRDRRFGGIKTKPQ